MLDSILVTKLFIPPAREGLVHRPGLIDRLNDGLDRKLTLVSAPAGFGKTTLVGAWAEQLLDSKDDKKSNPAVGWLSLDHGEADCSRFLVYLIYSLRQIEAMQKDYGQAAIDMLLSPQPPPVQAILISLLNELAASPLELILVLDDYHLLDSIEIDEAITYLLENLPPRFHLVILSRQDPHLPLSKLRASNQLNEIRAAELRFSPIEASEFLNSIMGLNLSEDDISNLETRTEGWIAGLQLAALSVQGRDDASERIKAFSGSHRLVLDYLMEEVLESQPEHIVQFLLQTSILDRLSGPLCDAITGHKDGQATLEALEDSNLFILPLDEERRWYRYHHLFADLLKQRLFAQNKDDIDELHTKAADWCERNGDPSRAVHHALEGNDLASALRLIENGAQAALDDSNFKFILDSVAMLPESALAQAPWLFIYHAWALLLTGQVEVARPKLEDLAWLLRYAESLDELPRREMLGYIAGLRVIFSSWLRDYETMTEHADQVRNYLPEDHWITGYCAMMMGGLFWGNGNLEAAKEAFAKSASAGKASGNRMMAVSGLCNLAHTLMLESQLQHAIDLYDEAFELAKHNGKALPVSGYSHVEIAGVLYELNKLDLAEQHVREGISLCRQMADGRAEKIGYFLLAKIQIATGEYSKVEESIHMGENAVHNPDVVYDMRGTEFPQVRFWLVDKNFTALQAWLEQNNHRDWHVDHFKTRLTFTMHARVLIAMGREHPEEPYLEEALALLEDILDMAESNGWGSKVIEILGLQALAYSMHQAESDYAISKIERALKLAESEGFTRTFVDEGPPMANLLLEASKRGIAPDYIQRLLAVFPTVESVEAASTNPGGESPGLFEPLSDREIEVLELIAQGLTNQEIADRLVLSLHTIKAHTRNIYGKLDVNSRTQAVARARSFDLLPPL